MSVFLFIIVIVGLVTMGEVVSKALDQRSTARRRGREVVAQLPRGVAGHAGAPTWSAWS